MLNDLNAADRKARPVFSGVIRYFPDALLEVARLSAIGNEQHNPGQPLHWDRSKSQDEGDALVRHQIDAGTFDTDGVRHSAKVAWRALAQLQKELEAAAATNHYLKELVPDYTGKPMTELEAYDAYAAQGIGANGDARAATVTKTADGYAITYGDDHSADNGELPKPPLGVPTLF